jgi:hypothetical protein
MSVFKILDHAPIGSIIEWSNGEPRPPEHHVASLYHWKRNNGSGLLVRKAGKEAQVHSGRSLFFMLRDGDSTRTFVVGCALRFHIASRPSVGSVRIFDSAYPDALLLHLADDWADAVAWLDSHPLPDAVPFEVTVDELAADHVEGRSAA